MSISAIGAGYQNQTKLPSDAIGQEQEKPGDASQISKLNDEIKQAEAEIKETLKEVQKAANESVSGASEKAQMLQSKILMKQQVIMTKQMQIKKIESPEKAAAGETMISNVRPKFDRYVSEKHI